jgi:hypothetical protein
MEEKGKFKDKKDNGGLERHYGVFILKIVWRKLASLR